MRILVLGGTRFLGRAIVDAALGRGDTVTLFNRGTTNPGLFPAGAGGGAAAARARAVMMMVG